MLEIESYIKLVTLTNCPELSRPEHEVQSSLYTPSPGKPLGIPTPHTGPSTHNDSLLYISLSFVGTSTGNRLNLRRITQPKRDRPHRPSQT